MCFVSAACVSVQHVRSVSSELRKRMVLDSHGARVKDGCDLGIEPWSWKSSVLSAAPFLQPPKDLFLLIYVYATYLQVPKEARGGH